MVDDQMEEEEVGSHLVVEVKNAPLEEERCLVVPQEEEVRGAE